LFSVSHPMPTYQRFSLFYAAALFQFRNLIWTGVIIP
jgi:hypothetical protein